MTAPTPSAVDPGLVTLVTAAITAVAGFAAARVGVRAKSVEKAPEVQEQINKAVTGLIEHYTRALDQEKARDTHWGAQIAIVNAKVAQAEAEKARAAAEASAALASQREDHARQLSDLEARNAALPNRDRPALDGDGRRLLFTPRSGRVAP